VIVELKKRRRFKRTLLCPWVCPMCSNSFRDQLHLFISSNADDHTIMSHLPVHEGDPIRVHFFKKEVMFSLECLPMIVELSYSPRIIRKVIIGRGDPQQGGELTYL